GQGAEFIVAVEQVGDGTLGDGNPAAGECAMDLGDAAMLGVAQATDQGDDVEAELVMRQGEVGFRLGAKRLVVARAAGLGTAADLESQAGDGVDGGNGAVVGVVEVEAVT